MKVVGKKVAISLGEPWDFPHNPIEGIIRKSYATVLSSEQGDKINESILIQAIKPFGFHNLKNEYFIASPRYVGETVHDLVTKGELMIGIYRIPEETAQADNPFEHQPCFGIPQSWGGIGIIKLET